jgi:predicted secreted hydrolase
MGLLTIIIGFSQKKPAQLVRSNITFLNNQEDLEGTNFEKAIETRPFNFPSDYGDHPEYLTEWWYYTGNLLTEDGRHFGYQLTFFRRAISDEIDIHNQSKWASNQVYLAHFALTNTLEKEHFVFDKISRGAVGIAGTETDPLFSIWLKDWEVIQVGDHLFQMKAGTEEVEIDLLLTDVKGVSLQGNQGLSQKGPEVGNASYYFSQTRLKTSGVIRIADEKYNVFGYSWMDHEFGTSTLGVEQVGWDWFSIQLDNDTEIMLFQIRQNDGTISQFSSGTLIHPNGETESLELSDFKIEVLDTWQTSDGINYPNKWEITIDRLNLALEANPMIDDQEMKLFFRYWEGAVQVIGTYNGEKVSGFGYVELTGYAQSMQGVF